MNNDTTLKHLPVLLVLVGTLFGLATVGIGVAACKKSDSQRELSRYVLLGSVFNFLSCISTSSILLVNIQDSRSLLILSPAMLLSGLAWSVIGALSIITSVQSHRGWKKYINRLTGDEVEEEDR
jgi:amino acid transporter